MLTDSRMTKNDQEGNLGNFVYTVINDRLIRECIKLKKVDDDLFHDDKKLPTNDIKREKMEFTDIEYLKFSAREIYRISNLEGFFCLKILQLDNNKIVKIENLGHLKSLERLDLSFNMIEKIENLEGLINLKDLSLFNNKIQKIENLNDQINLESLSIAKNNINDKESLKYLRDFDKLSMITIFDNPVCEQKYIKPFIIAYLKNLKFLDYRLIQPNELKDALDRYNGELQELDDREKQHSQISSLDEKKMKEKAELKWANVQGIDTLFEDIFNADEEYKNIKLFDYCLGEFFEKYRKTFAETVDEFRNTMISVMNKKVNEQEELESTMNESMNETDILSKQWIKEFEKKKKRIFEQLNDPMAENEDELYDSFENLKHELSELSDKLVEIEVNQTEGFADIIDEFLQNFKEMDASTVIQTYIKKLKNLEDTYSSEIKQRLLQEADMKPEGDVPDKIKEFLEDKDIISRALQASTDVHKEVIDRKEEELMKEEKKRMDGTTIKVKEDEHLRNRSRISEIWTFAHKIEQELNEEREMMDLVDSM